MDQLLALGQVLLRGQGGGFFCVGEGSVGLLGFFVELGQQEMVLSGGDEFDQLLIRFVSVPFLPLLILSVGDAAIGARHS